MPYQLPFELQIRFLFLWKEDSSEVNNWLPYNLLEMFFIVYSGWAFCLYMEPLKFLGLAAMLCLDARGCREEKFSLPSSDAFILQRNEKLYKGTFPWCL